MNRFEAAQIFGLLSDADQLKIVKMAYNHGIVTLNGIVEKMGIGENEAMQKIMTLVGGNLLVVASDGYAANKPLLEEAMGFLNHACGGHCSCHHDEHLGRRPIKTKIKRTSEAISISRKGTKRAYRHALLFSWKANRDNAKSSIASKNKKNRCEDPQRPAWGNKNPKKARIAFHKPSIAKPRLNIHPFRSSLP